MSLSDFIKDSVTDANNNSSQSNVDAKSYESNKSEIDILRSIDANLKSILQNSKTTSQSNAKDKYQEYKDEKQNRRNNDFGSKNDKSKFKKSAPNSFSDGLEEALWESLLGSDFKQNIGKSLNDFSKALGVEIKDIPGTLGKELGKNIIDKFKTTDLGDKLFTSVEQIRDKAMSDVKSAFYKGVNNYNSKHGSEFAKDAATNVRNDVASDMAKNAAVDAMKDAATGSATDAAASAAMAEGSLTAGAAIEGITSALVAMGPQLLAVVAAMVALEAITWALGPAIEGIKELFASMKKSANRYQETRNENLKYEKERLSKDVETIITEPFDILKESAQQVYDAWDRNIRLINGTQGYTKADLQSLLGEYSERLRSEGLSSVVNVADITDSLASVLKSGLSGAIAEEFAYQATILNSAIPTQDFFQYSSTYASIAANAIKDGKSQSDAIAYANEQLQLFANDVLYASRQLAGGFTSGLTNAEKLFEQAVQISQASKTYNSSEIAGVLTSVAAITGAIAPDLATSITDAIYKAAVGGNSSDVVALRSLAGINASNTEFLKAFAENPKQVFSNLFKNLADMYNSSGDAFMEKAEGYADLFGLSIDAFARIDFNYLADAISNMNDNSNSLSENLKLLASGESTTTAEQLRAQQINKYMIDEGLSYVLDNEAARAIQQHMWDEQLARELQETTFAVDLQGSALKFLEGIRQTIDNILSLLNGTWLIKRVANLVQTGTETKALDKDLKSILDLGKVGSGNATSYYQLTTRGLDLNLSPSLVSLMGGRSSYDAVGNMFDVVNNLLNYSARSDTVRQVGGYIDAINTQLPNMIASSARNSFDSISSRYSWGTLGKSAASAVIGSGSSVGKSISTGNFSSDIISKNNTAKLQSILDSLTNEDYIRKNFVDKNLEYEDWRETAVKEFKRLGNGVSLEDALDELGYSESQVENLFVSNQSKFAAEKQDQRNKTEEQFWSNTQVQNDLMISLQKSTNEFLDKVTVELNDIFSETQEFKKAFKSYFIDHLYYNKAFSSSDVNRIKTAQQKDTNAAIFALADVLSKSSGDLLDPTLQTNALLGQILLVAQAIMQQNNSKGVISLPDALSAMATNSI